METKKPSIKECRQNAIENFLKQKQYLMQTHLTPFRLYLLLPTLLYFLIVWQNRNIERRDLPLFIFNCTICYLYLVFIFFVSSNNKSIREIINRPFDEAFFEINEII